MKRRQAALLTFCAAAVLVAPARARGVAEAVETIQRARVLTRILFVTAHPDDESSSLLTYLSRGLGADVALLTVTRGQGGQNAIGPEQGSELGMIRTEELLAATRQYGVQLFFTRAVDFGYSKSAEETLKRWDDVALEDMVRVIRAFRPQVVINGWGGVHSGHGQHQAVGLLTPRAVAAATDPQQFPQQIAQGLPPWHTRAILQLARGENPPPGSYRVPFDEISSLWGKTYFELGLEGFANHRSQGVTAFLEVPFFRRPLYLVPEEGAKFDPATLAEPLVSLADRFPAFAGQLRPALGRIDRDLQGAREAALKLDWPETARRLAAAGKETSTLESQLNPPARPENGAADARRDLERVREHIDAALAMAAALHPEVRADRSELVAGETFSVRLSVRYRPGVPLESGFGKDTLVLPTGWNIAQMELEQPQGARFVVAIPAEAKPPASPADAIQPWPAPLVRARLRATIEGYTFHVEEPAMSIHTTSTRVETLPLELVPAVTLTVEPRQLLLRESQPPKQIELRARVRYHGTAGTDVTAGLEVPANWSASGPVALHFSGAGDQLVRFLVTPPEHPAAGAYELKPYARRGEEIFRTSREPLPSLPTRFWSESAEATAHVLNLVVPENLRVGYVAAENDPIPEALRQLGIYVELLNEVELAFGDLRRFDAIAIGIRAYELRDDLIRANQRLLDYAAGGGTLVAQYERDFVWNKLQPAPYAATMSQPAVRITDENSPVHFVDPASPLLNFPNRITQADFDGWVQERGLYFWSTFDPRYHPVLAMRDPGEGVELGGLVYARDGKGFYIYTGLAFFRQLPAGVPGVYRLFVNLLSQSRTKP